MEFQLRLNEFTQSGILQRKCRSHATAHSQDPSLQTPALEQDLDQESKPGRVKYMLGVFNH
jgi:hypothetical protein